MERFLAKLEEEVAGDGAMCGVGVAHERTKKPMEMLDAGSEEEGRKRRKTKMVTWRLPLHTEEGKVVDEVMKPKGKEAEMLVVDAGSKETAGGKRRKKMKLVALRSPPNMEDVLINELIDYMVPEPWSEMSECDFADVVFDHDLDSQISSLLKKSREYRADVLQQYRIKRYAELQLEVTDDEEEELTHELGQEEIEMPVVDVGYKEKFRKRRKKKNPKVDEAMKKKNPKVDEAMKTKKKKPNEDEAMDFLVDPGSEKPKLVTWRLSRELLEYLRTKEVMGFLATDTPRLLWPNLTEELFDKELKEEIATQFEENKEFDAYALYQYRSKGYAEIQEEVDEDEVGEDEV